MNLTALALAQILLPACGAIAIAVVRAAGRRAPISVGLAFSLASWATTLALSLSMRGLDPIVLSFEWLPRAGLNMALSADSGGLLLLLAAGVMFPASLASFKRDGPGSGAGPQASVLFLHSAAAAAIMASNPLTMVAAAMAMVVPGFCLIFAGHGLMRQHAAHKTALVIAAASAPLLFAALLVPTRPEPGSFARTVVFLTAFAPWALVMGHGFPLHSWFTTAAAEGPRPAAAIFSAVTPCVAACGFERFAAPALTTTLCAGLPWLARAAAFAPAMLFCAGFAYFALVSLSEREGLKRVAYLSCSVTGIAMAAVMTMRPGIAAAGMALLAFKSLFFGALFLLSAGKAAGSRGDS